MFSTCTVSVQSVDNFATSGEVDSIHIWQLSFNIGKEKCLTIDGIEFQNSAHIQCLRADQLEDGDVPQTCHCDNQG